MKEESKLQESLTKLKDTINILTNTTNPYPLKSKPATLKDLVNFMKNKKNRVYAFEDKYDKEFAEQMLEKKPNVVIPTEETLNDKYKIRKEDNVFVTDGPESHSKLEEEL